jgi:CRISPR/Cas system-associated protein endoribonuclease Cas2
MFILHKEGFRLKLNRRNNKSQFILMKRTIHHNGIIITYMHQMSVYSTTLKKNTTAFKSKDRFQYNNK